MLEHTHKMLVAT